MESMSQRCVKITREDMTMLLLKDDLEAPLETSKLSSIATTQLDKLGTEIFLITIRGKIWYQFNFIDSPSKQPLIYLNL